MVGSISRITPFLIFAIGITLLLANNIISTSPTISDTDPSTYIIVPMLMLIPFAVFMYKTGIKPDVKRADILVGLIAFLLFVLGTLYLRFQLPLTAQTLRSDMVLFPLAIASFVALIFGIKNIHRFWPMMMYSVFASPVLLKFIFDLNMSFASLNTQIVYSVLHILYKNVSYIAPITINFNGSLIGIGEACAGIGALIAILMFLIPVAYFYNGKIARKLYWLVSAVLLLFILNLIRMFSISALWIYYGFGETASFIHLFAGILLFYLAIIIMILIADRFKITFPVSKTKQKNQEKAISNYAILGYGLVVILGMFYIYSSSPYTNQPQISPLSIQYLNQNLSTSAGIKLLANIITNATESNFTVNAEPIGNNSIALLATNRTFDYTHPIVIIVSGNSDYSNSIIYGNTKTSSSSYVDPNGNKVSLYGIVSQNHGFYISYSRLISQTSSENAEFNVDVIIPSNVIIPNLNCHFNRFDTYSYSSFGGATQIPANLTNAFCVSDIFIKPVS